MRDFKIPYIADKITFSKRLAQCLNPIIPPGTHQQALSVYELLFNNMGITYSEKQGTVITQKYIKNFAEDIGIYSLGLFPFFQSASVQVIWLYSLKFSIFLFDFSYKWLLFDR